MKDQYIDIVGPEVRHCWNVIKYWKAMKEDKEKNFEVQIESTDAFVGEIMLRITHNGHQWHGWSLTKQEAEKIIQALKDHFQI